MCVNRRYLIRSLLGGASLVLSPAWAQTFPDRPLRIVVAAPPGGTADIIGRIVASHLVALLKRPVIVDNKPGGAGMVAVQDLLKSPPDGHTLLLGVSGIVTEVPHVVKLPVDPFRVLMPLAELGRAGLMLAGHPGLPANHFNELVAYIKARPGKVNYASYAAGSVSHTLGEALNELVGLDAVHVPYRGSMPGLTDVMAGHVSMMFDAPGSVLPLYHAGKVKVFATTSPERNPAAPDVPTFAELGLPAMTETPWLAMYCTPAVPAEVQAMLHTTLGRLLQQPLVRQKWAEIGIMPPVNPAPTQQFLQQTLQKEHAAQGRRLAAIGFKADDNR